MKNSVYTFYEQTIIENIDFDGYSISAEDCEAMELYDKVQKTYEIFVDEYIHDNNKHLNEVFLFSEWLTGLPSTLSVPFYYNEILKNAENAGIDPKCFRDEGGYRERFLQNYWLNLSNAFFTLKENL